MIGPTSPLQDGNPTFSQLRYMSKMTLQAPSILHRILHRLPISDIITVGQLTRQHRQFTTDHIHHRVNAEIRSWIIEPDYFLRFLDYCDTVLGGALIPWLVFGFGRRPDTLSVYVGKHPHHFSWIATFLQETERYERSSYVVVHQTTEEPLTRSALFRKRTGPSVPFIYIRLMESAANSALHPVVRSPSTMSMNYLTGQRFVCLYPRFLKKKIAMLHPRYSDSSSVGQLLRESWNRAGITVYGSAADLPFPCGEFCPTGWRSNVDTACLCYKYGTGTFNLTTVDMTSFTWTLSFEADMPEVRCPNPRCPRSDLMLRRRDGHEPECPYGINLRALQN